MQSKIINMVATALLFGYFESENLECWQLEIYAKSFSHVSDYSVY